MAPTLLMIPGLNGSGPDHWQTCWQAAMPSTVRVEQADWDHPRLEPWLAALVAKITEHPDCILVAHSLGCALVANAVKREPA